MRTRRTRCRTRRSATLQSAAFLFVLLLGQAPLGASEGVDPQTDKPGKSAEEEGKTKKKEKGASAKKKKDADAESDDSADTQKGPEGFRFVMKSRYPSVRFGKVARVDFHAKLQTDFRFYDPEVITKEGEFDMHRARISVQGNVFKFVEYEVEREIRDVFRNLYEDPEEGHETKNPWDDVYVNIRY